MSQENVEVIGEAFAAWLRGDDRWLEAMDPEIEWTCRPTPCQTFPSMERGARISLGCWPSFGCAWVDYTNATKGGTDPCR